VHNKYKNNNNDVEYISCSLYRVFVGQELDKRGPTEGQEREKRGTREGQERDKRRDKLGTSEG